MVEIAREQKIGLGRDGGHKNGTVFFRQFNRAGDTCVCLKNNSDMCQEGLEPARLSRVPPQINARKEK